MEKLNPLLKAAIKSGLKESVIILLSKSSDINSRDSMGNTPLMLSVENSQYEISKLLLEQGSDTSLKNNEGKTALDIAAHNNNSSILELFSDSKTENNADTIEFFDETETDEENGFEEWQEEEEFHPPEEDFDRFEELFNLQSRISDFQPFDSDADWSDTDFQLILEKNYFDETDNEDQLKIKKYLSHLISAQWIDLKQLETELSFNLEKNSEELIDFIWKYTEENDFPVFDEKINLFSEISIDDYLAEDLLNKFEASISTSSAFSEYFQRKMKNLPQLNKELEDRLGYLMEKAVRGLISELAELNEIEWARLNTEELDLDSSEQIEEKAGYEINERSDESGFYNASEIEDAENFPDEFITQTRIIEREDRNLKSFWSFVCEMRDKQNLSGNNDIVHQNPSWMIINILIKLFKDRLNTNKFEFLEKNITDYEGHRDRFFESNLKLVLFVSKKYLTTGLPLEDIFNEGCFGLMRAVEKFDRRLGYKFSTYAFQWIKQTISRYIDNNLDTVRIPVHTKVDINTLNKEIEKIETSISGKPELSDIYHYSEFSIEKINFLLQKIHEYHYLDHMNENEKDELFFEYLKHDNYEQNNIFFGKEQKENILRAVSTLNRKEREVVTLRYGLESGVEMTLEEIGHLKGVTRERIRQIQVKAEANLRHPSRAFHY